jgi:hypothetical protein
MVGNLKVKGSVRNGYKVEAVQRFH